MPRAYRPNQTLVEWRLKEQAVWLESYTRAGDGVARPEQGDPFRSRTSRFGVNRAR
jgi:hypothetical protein